MQAKVEMLAELVGQRCRCGHKKAAGAAYCFGCFKSLPSDQGQNLYLRFGKGYEQAKAKADETLDSAGRRAKVLA
jgi:hypothetical protein